MPRILKICAVIGLVLFLMTTWAIVRLAQVRAADAGGGGPRMAMRTDEGSGVAAEDAAGNLGLAIPEFSLIDQNGDAFSREKLRGNITIVNFVFTHCPFVCPTLMEKMVGLSVALKNEPVQFLSISVDPAHDTPEVLREFAKLHGADKPNWTLLTGEKAEVDRVIKDGMKFALTEDPSNPIQLGDGRVMNNILHPSWFLLLGPDVEVLSLYRSDDPVNMQVLLNDVRRLAKDLPKR